MPQAVVLYFASLQLLITGVLCHFGKTTPITLSSTKRKQPARPGIFVLIEDVVAVDGGGGTLYREVLIARYEASPYFRTLLRQLNWFWGLGSLAVALMTTILVYTVDSEDAASGLGKEEFLDRECLSLTYLGWSLCWVWAGVGAAITTFWVKRALRHEKQRLVRRTTAAFAEP